MPQFVSYNSEKSFLNKGEGINPGIVHHNHPGADEIICSSNFFESNEIIGIIQKIEGCTSFLAMQSGRERMGKNHECKKLLDEQVKNDQILRKILLQQLAKLCTNQRV